MKKLKDPKNKWLHVRLSDDEFKTLQSSFSATSERKLSGYVRKILLGKPMIGTYRNLSADALIVEFSKLIKDLNGAANNFNQAVHVLHTLQHSTQFLAWLKAYERDKALMLVNIRHIREFINKTSEVWLQL